VESFLKIRLVATWQRKNGEDFEKILPNNRLEREELKGKIVEKGEA